MSEFRECIRILRRPIFRTSSLGEAITWVYLWPLAAFIAGFVVGKYL